MAASADDIDYSDIEAKYQVQYDDGFDNMLVVDGVPVIDKSKLEKLVARICKEFSRKGVSIKPDDVYMPWNESTGKNSSLSNSKTVDDANLALGAMHNHPFDAKHQFKVNRFTDIERYADMDETYIEPETEEYAPREHLRAWLADPQGRDQYVTYRGEDVEIYWHGKPSQSELAMKPDWKDFLYVAWSPLGTYIATLHRQGVRLWGGSSWKPQQRFAHPLVKLIDFSPCEQYLVTWSNEAIVVPEGAPQGPQYLSPDDEGNNIAVWDIKSGDLLRTFPTVSENDSPAAKKQMQWPALKWSPDDKYVARVTPGQMISVHELPSMYLHGKKSLKIEGVVDFEWCPQGDRDREDAEKDALTSTNGAAAAKNLANQPARVTLLGFPSRAILRQKNLFNVTECKLYWQNQGDFLCVKVDRHTKTKKSIFCNLEIFRVREKDYPVEVLELKDTVTDFSWEPKGERFAIVSSNDPNLGNPGPGITIKTDVSFYQLEHGKNDFKLLRTLPSRTSNAIRWSPRGRHVVLATVGSSSKSELEFWDLDFNIEDAGRREGQVSKEEWGSGIQLLGTADHYALTDVEWDPSGRYLATSASSWTHTLENGYAIWDFRGQEITKQIQDRFKHRTFDEDDAAEESNVSAELVALRKRLVDEWNAWRLRSKAEFFGDGGVGAGKEGKVHSESEEKEEIEVWIDEVIDQVEEEVVE
ncbi:eukaryotic translation initiation factor eIF2A-domain-containing protein [Mycena filopes]|nr:eukaryotic translation initiation factor eIF2A-domain-containing protein [Mycena filopes]